MQRVVANLAEPLLASGEARGFIHSKRRRRLIEVANSAALVSGTLRPSTKSTRPPGSAQEIRAWIRRAARVTRRCLTLLPADWIARLGHAQRHILRFVDRFHGHRTVQFAPGDCVLVLGRAWNDPAVLDLIRSEKNESRQVRVVVLLYDLVPVLYPHLHALGVESSYRRYLEQVADVADAVFSISHATHQDWTQYLAENGLRVPASMVLRLGDDFASDATAAPPGIAFDDDYLLYVATFEARKNHHLLYMTWKLAAERGVALPRLVMAGRIGWTTEDIRYLFANDPSLRDKVAMVHGVSDAELLWLYEHCLFAIYPSFYEGWGLPVAEALQLGKFVIASGNSAIPEIAGNLLDYFSPYNPDECLTTILRYLDRAALAEKEREVRARFVPRSWLEAVADLRAMTAVVTQDVE
jgi:glycosyltransferase involved in cell wall biosynthesis